jgi:hypothetical protein
MKESLFEAKNELKRVDHQIYVSLKYTRTVDVLMNTIGRMIDSYNELIETLFRYAIEKKKIAEEYIPIAPVERANLIKDLYKEDIILENMDRYLLFRKVIKTNPKKDQEYRRHVNLKTFIGDQEIIFNIDIATEDYHKIKEFYEWIEKTIEE